MDKAVGTIHMVGRRYGSTNTASAKNLSDQALMKMKAVSQLRQAVRVSPKTSNRTALAYNLSQDFLIALQYLPAAVLTRVQPLLGVQEEPVLNNHFGKLPDDQKRNILSHSPSHLNYTSSNPSNPSEPPEPPPPPSSSAASASSSVVASATSILNSITSTFNYNYGNTPAAPPPPIQVPLEKASPPPSGPRRHRDEENIHFRTKYLTSVVNKHVGISTPHNFVHHLDALYTHLLQHHDTIPAALEKGLLKSLLKTVKLYEDDIYVLNRARELLAMVGHNPPVKGPGINVLSIDGGGVRGLVAIEVLRRIEKATNKRIHELFDYICGVSTGSILAFLLGAHHRTLDECEALYKDLSRQVFSQNSFIGAGSLMWSHAYYHTPTWEKILKKQMGDSSLLSLARDPNSPRVGAISTVVNHERIAPYVFRTYSFRPGVHVRYNGGFEHDMWEAVRASAAAPTYFEEIRLGKYLHQDGGILVNNPCSVALSEAKSIWNGVPLHCVVSLGTGLTLSSRIDPTLQGSVPTTNEANVAATSLSWKGKFLRVLDSATDTEAIHYTLNELLPRDVYFRFNPYVSEVVSLDEGCQDKLGLIQSETRDYLDRNYQRIDYVGKILSKEKGIAKKVTDWWSY